MKAKTKKKTKTEDAIQEAIDYGIDVTLLYENLKLTPTERLEKHREALELAEEFRRAGEKARGEI